MVALTEWVDHGCGSIQAHSMRPHLVRREVIGGWAGFLPIFLHSHLVSDSSLYTREELEGLYIVWHPIVRYSQGWQTIGVLDVCIEIAVAFSIRKTRCLRVHAEKATIIICKPVFEL